MICKDMFNIFGYIKIRNFFVVYDVNIFKVEFLLVRLKKVIYYKSFQNVLIIVSYIVDFGDKFLND